MHPALQILLVAIWLLAAPLSGSSQAAAAPFRNIEPAQLFSCRAELPVFVDVDGNGVIDRIDPGYASDRAGIQLTLNGTHQIVLTRAVSACRLSVVDIDLDEDVDLVALTVDGRLLIWRNVNGTLGLEPSKARPRLAAPDAVVKQRARTPGYADLNGRHVAAVVPAVSVHVLPSGYRMAAGPPTAVRQAWNDRLASRAPPAC